MNDGKESDSSIATGTEGAPLRPTLSRGRNAREANQISSPRRTVSEIPPVAETHGPSMGTMLEAVRKRIWLVVAFAAVATFAAAAYGLSRTKIYEARMTLQIDPRAPTPLGQGVEQVVETSGSAYWSTLEYYNTQHKLIDSVPIAQTVVRELGLEGDRSFIVNERSGTVKEHGPPPTATHAAKAVMDRLHVEPVKDTRLVDVSFEDADKDRATRVLESVLRAYMTHNANRTLESTSSAVEWLGEQLEELRAELSESEIALHRYKMEKQIASIGLDSQASMLEQEMRQLTEEHTRVGALAQKASARLNELLKIEPDDPDSLPQTELLNSHELSLLRADYISQRREKTSLLAAGKGESHPAVLAAQAGIDAVKRALSAEVRSIQEGALRDLAALQKQAGGLRAMLVQAEKQALELNLMDIEYDRLERTKNNNEKLYSLVLERSKEAGLTQRLKVSNIRVFVPPVPSNTPIKPHLGLILVGGSLAGLILGLGAAIGREYMDRTIKSSEDIETKLGLTPLGVIPAAVKVSKRRIAGGRRKRSERSVDLLVHREPTSGFAEALRAVRTNLLFMAPDEPFRRLLITSALPSEGKTTVAASLAIAVAQTGHRVVLVDCDLRRPRLQGVFPGDSRRSTLSESLLRPDQLRPLTLTTEVPNLSVLPAGPTPPNPSELLHSEAFGALLDRLSDLYDLVLLDSPPLIVTDAAVMSARVDGAVIVVRAFQTALDDVARAARSLQDVGGNVVGAVLNATEERHSGYGYGYGGGRLSGTDGPERLHPSEV